MTESYYDTLKRHGVKLSLAMLLGNLLHTALLYAALLLYAILAVLLITMFSSVPSVLEADSNQVAESFASEPGGIVLGVVLLLLFVPAVQLPNSFWIAGAYGAASSAVFRGETSISFFFTTGFKHLWRIFAQQVLLAILFMGPILVMTLFGGLLAGGGEASDTALGMFGLLFFVLLFVLLIGYLWISLHAPLILIVERTAVWDSIRLAFRLTLKKPGQTLLSGLIALGILLGTYFSVGLILVILFALLTALTGGNDIIAAIFAVFGVLILLCTIFFAFTASLLSIVHRYKTRLRSDLFPDNLNREGFSGGATPGYAPGES
ncbi:hypothetical protein CLV97_102124 [Planifilum fimeticola]|uniref:Glycerophosphoryl diester phosphodiesterase family protein n=1 Tax=Planifilum fimeticola TaxID=201975 RepID=A0A2T0LIP9_9BACL|nr:hypothetical protein [Planifilum fimeticola]PRX42336.1 hypothetical protein CLV97_102124 [Planifilum fimeticola]